MNLKQNKIPTTKRLKKSVFKVKDKCNRIEQMAPKERRGHVYAFVSLKNGAGLVWHT